MKRLLVVLVFMMVLGVGMTPLVWSQSNPLQGQVSETKVITYPNAEAQAEVILNRLLSANGIARDRVQGIKVIEAKELNAYTDGKTISFSSTLWNLLNSDNQRAFVISHELSHITLNHIQKTQARRVGLTILDYLLSRRLSDSQSGVRSQLVQLATAAGSTLVDSKFSRQAELQADERGIQLMSQAGYQPSAAIEVFNLFEQYSPTNMPEFLMSHPLNKSRMAALAKKYPVK